MMQKMGELLHIYGNMYTFVIVIPLKNVSEHTQLGLASLQ